ncbi:hypothetical protein MycrhDRAFT_3269 [Mycolicibacterium rhodesiae JS60]|nr:hypothetical protein MycrhDRAFT_3269 [Mycolicibacterium rhodesiae JS60]
MESNNWTTGPKGYSVGPKLGLTADYMDRGIADSAEAVASNVVAAAHDYTAGYQTRYADRWADLWGFVHRYPRFWTAEPLILPSLFVDRHLAAIYAYRPSSVEIESRFARDRDAWLIKSATMSSIVDMAMLPEYQRIIGLGADAVPLIINELRQEVDHWFWALVAIVGEDHGVGASTLSEAAENWIAWFDSLTSDE